MDAKKYSFSKSSGNVLDFATLQETQKCLVEAGHAQLAQSVAQILMMNRIDKPVHHNKPEERYTDYYHIDISVTDIEIIVSMFCDKEISGLTADFETTPLVSYYASLLDKWNGLIS